MICFCGHAASVHDDEGDCALCGCSYVKPEGSIVRVTYNQGESMLIPAQFFEWWAQVDPADFDAKNGAHRAYAIAYMAGWDDNREEAERALIHPAHDESCPPDCLG